MSVYTDLLERVRALLFRRRDERELAEELQFHLDMEAQLGERLGLSAAEARRRGLIALGGMERVKDDVRDARGTRLAGDTLDDFRFALRTLSHSVGFALVAILTLAVGIGGTTAVYSAVDAVLLQPLPYQQPGQLVRLYQDRRDTGERGFVTPVHFLEFRSRMASFEATAAINTYSQSGADVGTGESVHRIHTLPVSADYLDVVRRRPKLGRGFRRDDETGPPVVVISDQLWKEDLHGDPSAVGRVLTMNAKPFTIAGVMPADFVDPLVGRIDAWVTIDVAPGRDAGEADNHYLSIVARLRSGVTLQRAQAELDALGVALATKYPRARLSTASLVPLKEDVVGSSARSLEIMLGAVALVLLLVCVNIANLLLVRASERAREFALRSALGAERTRLVRQMLIESLTLAVAGGVAGLIVARLAMSAIVALGAGSIPRLATLTLEPRLLIFSGLITSVCAVGFGLAPALHAAGNAPSGVLREQSRAATGGGAQMRLREWLVVSQVALAFVLLVGAGLLIASFQRIRQIDLGFQPRGVLTFEVHLPDARYDSTARATFYEAFAAKLETLPGVTAAGGVSKLPATGPFNEWGTQALSGPLANAERGNVGAQQRVVSGDYFRAAGIPLLDGRAFDSRDDATAPPRALISKRLAAELFPGVRAVGQRLNAGNRDMEVIGVVGDLSLNAEGRHDIYVYHAHRQFAGDRNWALTQVVRTSDALDVVPAEARRALAEMDPQLVAYQPMPLDVAVGRGEAQRQFTLRILTAFAAVALALSALGLFGVLSYAVRLRAREFSIRMALGAEAGAILRLVLRQGLTATAVGIAFGLAGALALSRVMVSLVFQVSPLDPWVIGGAILFMAVVSGVAAYVPAYWATRVDPRTTLQ